ncbi:hypothetical protein DPMN_091229 [Dreissena polymorpha]|uniref:Uncharacterized protein n=1 Tax=Dreissena polymorpha TaxID=45954 RepID=A0A9D4L1Q0_DREPO|nr:hypothetical protein DPMN_091229 [Dreissena polymorpha]
MSLGASCLISHSEWTLKETNDNFVRKPANWGLATNRMDAMPAGIAVAVPCSLSTRTVDRHDRPNGLDLTDST